MISSEELIQKLNYKIEFNSDKVPSRIKRQFIVNLGDIKELYWNASEEDKGAFRDVWKEAKIIMFRKFGGDKNTISIMLRKDSKYTKEIMIKYYTDILTLF